MNGIEKHAVFYRGYLADDRSLLPLIIVLITGAAFWLLVYLIGVVGPAPTQSLIPSRLAPVAASRLEATAPDGTLSRR